MSTVYIQSYGSGTPLVFLHGWGFDSQIWQSLIPDIATYHVFLVDLPGFGGSQKMSWEDFSRFLLDALPEKFMLAGWSLGGLFASRLAVEAPHRVLKLLQIASTPYFIQADNWAGIAPEILDDFYRRFITAPELTRRLFIQSQLPDLKHRPATEEQAIPITGLEEGLLILKQWDLRAHLAQLTIPVAYLFGRLDRIVSYKIAQQLMVNYPHFHYTILRHAGHMPFLSHRSDFLAWLSEVA